MILMISYDLKNSEEPRAYVKVAQTIQERAGKGNYIKALFSQWFVDTQLSCGVWHEVIEAVADEDDSWFINEVTEEHRGWLPEAVVEWLDVRF